MPPSTVVLQLYMLCGLVVFHAHGTSNTDSDLLKAAAEAAWTEGESSEEDVVKQTSTKSHTSHRKASDEVSLAMSATKQLVQEVSNQGYIPVQQSQRIRCDKEGFCDCNGDCGSDLCVCKEALACCGDGVEPPNLGGLTGTELQALHSDAKRQRVLDTSWRELGPNLQAAAHTLGYDAASWDLNEGVAAEGVSWGRLTIQQRKAAIALGYSEQTWFETLKKKDLSFLHRLERGGVWKLDKKDAKFLEDLELNKNIAHLTSKDVDYLHQQEKESQALEQVEVAFLDELKRDAPWLIWGSAAMCATGFVIFMILLLQHAIFCPHSLKTFRREDYEEQL